jgi:hypothetical protein
LLDSIAAYGLADHECLGWRIANNLC